MQTTVTHPETRGQTGRPRSGRRRFIIPAIAVLALVGVLLLVTGVIPTGAAPATVQSGDIVAVTRGDIDPSTTAIGQLEPAQTALLSPGTAGLVEAVPVREGDTVAAGDLLLQLDTTALALRVERARQSLALQEANLAALQAPADPVEIAAARAAVASAQAQLDSLLAGPDAQDLAEAAANVRAQQAGVAAAAATYNSTLDSISDVALAAAEADVISAQIALENARQVNEAFANGTTHENMLAAEEDLAIAQAALDELRAGPNAGTLNSAAYGIAAASAGVDQAQASYDQLAAGATQAQIAAATATLAGAEATLASLQTPATTEEITIAQAGVTQAQLALQDAEAALAEAAITAPFAGIVTEINVAVGEIASGAVVALASPEMQVVLSVDEIDIGALSPGQAATINLETWPDVALPATVSAIAPSAGGSGGVVTYDVTLVLEATDLPLRSGMTANAQLLTAGREDVLRVPNAAITADRAAGTYTVNRVTGTDPTAVEIVTVTIGLRDVDFTEITGGLAEGDQVLIGQLVAPTQNFGPGSGDPLEDN